MENKIEFDCLVAKQSEQSQVVSFVAEADHIDQIAQISRVKRDEEKQLVGFQRGQVANHIEEIHDYLNKNDAVLPNSIILAFIDGVDLKIDKGGRTGKLSIDITDPPSGYVVDGQQRFTALKMLKDKKFEVFVSLVICKNEEELQKQFILINNTKPLSKDLIYELLPSVDGLPHRLGGRSFASKLVQKLNFMDGGVFHNIVKLHTNPRGVINSTALQKVIMQSKRDGALRDIFRLEGDEGCLDIVNDFYSAVQQVFEQDWFLKDGSNRVVGVQNPRTSRLVHSAGITCLGVIMDASYSLKNAKTKKEFVPLLNLLKPHVAWTSGTWNFLPLPKQWSEIQNTQRDLNVLREFLFKTFVEELKKQDGAKNE